MKKPKAHTARLYLHTVDDLFVPSLLAAARRKSPATLPPVLTHRQWNLWRLVSGLKTGNYELHQVGVSQAAIKASVAERMKYDASWLSVDVHALPGGCFRVVGKTSNT